MAKKLSPKRQAFVAHYIVCWNGAEAARLAGYSVKTARNIACKLLRLPEIQEAIQKALDELMMSADEAMVEISTVARETEKVSDKLRALELISKIHNMQTEHIQNDVEIVVRYEDVQINGE